MKIILVFFLFLSTSHASCVNPYLLLPLNSTFQDRYKNFKDLSQNEIEGRDFRIAKRDIQSRITIIAPHGGWIELGTSVIAQSIAESVFNLYLFDGIKPKGNSILHLTSSNFDEPSAVDLMNKSDIGISIHGFKEDQVEFVEIGGSNTRLGMAIAEAIASLGIKVKFPSARFPGDGPSNIVNRARFGGVQLELSSKLRADLISNSNRLVEFANAIKSALK